MIGFMIFILSISYQFEPVLETSPLDRFALLIGRWEGTGNGFGNKGSVIKSNFSYSLNKNYIEVRNESWFDPTDDNPNGSHHLDQGFISYDKSRKTYIFRQFNSEGFINKYLLDAKASNINQFVFVTEHIENFVEGGKARWTIKIISENHIETIFDLSMPNQEFACMGTNNLYKQ